ncbi:RNA-binding protein 34 isoform X5 [Oryctolagus cuniculus]|uniref:RNA-binding protein 34 isoform X5 n=1 Tax=Oryctolagus cuniculus TaxID=9986 RepID=UPI002232A392|nr:RNA-binding protein 34 isoform X5 [Oryctolagus cuniculus]
MALEGKNKKKRSAEPGEKLDGGVGGHLTGDYLVGQVAGSLAHGKRPSRGGTGRLASLFSSLEPQVQPVYVPVPKETTKKRKRDEEEESTLQTQKPFLQEGAKKVKTKKKLSEADKNLANRESALASADLEEESQQKEGQKGKNSQSKVKVAARKVLDDADHNFDVSQRKKTQINQEEERLKNERTVFVGNLPVTCNKKKLKSFFKEYGPIESVRFRSLIPAEGTLSKKLAAIKNGTHIADGFRIRVDLASETSSRDKRSVFVGNLPYIEETAVEEHFLDCGNIVAVRIVRDQITGIGKGFGYVLFENKDSVHLALKLNNSELMGRKLRVMRSVNKEKLNSKSKNSNPVLKTGGKPKEGLNFASKKAEGHSKGLFIGEKAVFTKKKRGQKKSGPIKKQRKQK